MTAGISALFVLICAGLIYFFPPRAWYRHWGATDAEIGRSMLGDNEAPDANYETTLAVSIDAAPLRFGGGLSRWVIDAAACIATTGSIEHLGFWTRRVPNT